MSDEQTRKRETSISLGVCAGAAAWSFAEATLFFVAPVVYLSGVAVRNSRAAWHAGAWAIIGALIGGTLMFAWGRSSPELALATLDRVPTVSHAMIQDVGEQLQEDGLPALFRGPVTGTPYKIYATQSGILSISYLQFLLMSILARAAPFTALILAGIGFRRLLPRGWTSNRASALHAMGWFAYYIVYFIKHPG